MAELGIQAAKRVDDECLIGDGVPDVVQSIGEGLEAGEVGVDRHLALVEAVKLLQSIHRALHAVVAEETMDGRPKRVGRCVRVNNNIHHCRGD
ncbi:hypothetical protein GUJ93_ZPchr0002g25774 [Zizania palustris]|uniref:Uncharacterized protein n=1 Tax=Zizania palustris TaxID=103762 RepID=A0A8J5SQ50_ZIZPA|nr:hypothetical protein GUJ93_ZPchr0002g25774 [Zizania palustris]